MPEGTSDYTTTRDDLDQALEELAQAGYRVVCGPVVQEVFTSPDPAPPEFVVRIADDARSWEGRGTTADEAFEEALATFGRG